MRGNPYAGLATRAFSLQVLMNPFVRLAALALFATSAFAQSDINTGEIGGAVTDPSRSPIAGCHVTATNADTARAYSTATSGSGDYHILLLPPGAYSLRFEKAGFQPVLITGLRVTVGQSVTVDQPLQLGTQQTIVEVSGAVPAVEIERSGQANTLEREWVQQLPIDRRDYLAFSLLLPGVADSNPLVDNNDYRLRQTPQSGLSFYGSNGRGNSVTVDGGEANDGSGGVRSTLSQEAVQEFQVNRSNYTAELGGASGGVVNIVSRSGSNAWHGSLFSFFRHQSLDAGNPFALVLEGERLTRLKPPSQRQQFGGSLGGPIRRNRTFVFGAFEGLMRDESAVTSLLTDLSIFQPTPAQEAVLGNLPPQFAEPLRAALTSPPSTVDFFRRNSGVFPYQSRVWRFSLRLDHALGADERDRLFFRHGFAHANESNANIRALVGASRGTDENTLDPTTIAGWTRTFSPRAFNQAHVQWGYRRFKVNSLDTFGPEIRIAGFGVFNRDINLPSANIERRYEVRDVFTRLAGRHTFKAGGSVLVRGTYSRSEVFFPGRFTFGDLPGSVLNPALPPTFVINGLQSYNLGLAQTYVQGFGDPAVASTNPLYSVFVQDTWQVRPNLTFDFGLRYELDTRNPPLPTDKNNLAPRFGFAWSPGGDRKSVVRGGYGIFYSPIYYQIDWVVRALNNIGGRRQIAQAFSTILDPGPAASHIVFSTLRAQGVLGTRAITPQDLAPFGITFPHTGPLPPFTVLFENTRDYANPYAQQASVGIEREIAPDLTVSAGYIRVRTLKLPRTRDGNLRQAPVDPALGIRVWSDPARDFIDPLIGQRNIYESTANASYHGALFEVRKRFSRSFGLNANYTLSRANDDVTDFNVDYVAFDQTDQRAEYARSSFDQRHKAVVYALWDAPWKVRVAPIFRAGSGRPFNLLAGYDLNQDRHENADRPAGAPRNSGIGPAFWSVDLRLNREFALRGERLRIDLTAEAFNLFNHVNYASVNNVVGNMAPPFEVRGRNDRSPSQPLGFTGVHDMRRVQLAVRLVF